jgi:hypothetical protein
MSIRQVLGKKIEEICRDNEIDSEDKKLVNEMLDVWESAPGRLTEKEKPVWDKINKSPNRKRIRWALTNIYSEFHMKTKKQ